MFAIGFAMAQVFVPSQAAAFATISSAATGRASTMFNAVRQLGGAIGVALLTTVIVLTMHGHQAAAATGSITAYRVAFLVAAALALVAVASALTIDDADAANTIPIRRPRRAPRRASRLEREPDRLGTARAL
jgi:MFS family permease